MLQRLDCSKCGVNGAEKPLIALPMMYICHDCYDKQKSYEERIKEREAEIQEVSNQLMDLYESCQKTAKPEIYGSILGLHERLEKALKVR